jgi:hypothetical protein
MPQLDGESVSNKRPLFYYQRYLSSHFRNVTVIDRNCKVTHISPNGGCSGITRTHFNYATRAAAMTSLQSHGTQLESTRREYCAWWQVVQGRWLEANWRQELPRRWTAHLTQWISVVLQKLLVAQLLKMFPKFYGILRLIVVLTRARHRSPSWVRLIQFLPRHPSA